MSKAKTHLLKTVTAGVPHLPWKAVEDDYAIVKLHKDKESDRTLCLVMQDKKSVFSTTSTWGAWLAWKEKDSVVPEDLHFGDEDQEYYSPKEAFDSLMADLAVMESAFATLSGRKQ